MRFRERIVSPANTNSIIVGKMLTRRRSDNVIVSTTTFTAGGGSLKPSLQRTHDSVHSGPPYTEGGEFQSVKISLPQEEVKGVVNVKQRPDLTDGSTYLNYVGGFVPNFGGTDNLYEGLYSTSGIFFVPNFVDPIFPQWKTSGSSAYNRLKPRLEKAGLGVALREARDIPGMLRQTAKGFHDLWKTMGGDINAPFMKPKSLADNFLNEQFGWVPFLSDIGKIAKVYQNSKRYIDETTRNNGLWVKKRATLVDSFTVTPVTSGVAIATPSASTAPFDFLCRKRLVKGSLQNAVYQITEEELLHEWATGSFLSYRPEFDVLRDDYSSAWNSIQRQMTLYGVRITPSNIYKATPWTWLADWFSNTGDQVDLFNDLIVDSIVSRKLYRMRHRTRRLALNQTIFFHTGDVNVEWGRISEIKQRLGATTPYGFDLSWDNLTPRQGAILAALGLSRSF
jgi:hypothetical protein